MSPSEVYFGLILDSFFSVRSVGLKRIPRDLVLSLWWERLLEASRTRAYVGFSASGVHSFKAQKGIQGSFLSVLTNIYCTITVCYVLVSRLLKIFYFL